MQPPMLVRSWMRRSVLLLILLALLFPTLAQAAPAATCPPSGTTRLYVMQDSSGTTGEDWAKALPTLQDALWIANPSNCPGLAISEIWVAAGVYYPDEGMGQTDNNRNATFQLRNDLAIYGGFAGTESLLSERNWQSNATILSGDIDQDSTLTGNSYHVVTGSGTNSSAVLDGFTVTGGNADGTGPAGSGNGGGIYNINGSPTLSNLVISQNAAANGGGIYNDGSSPTITNVSIHQNTATADGGGIYNRTSSNPTLTNVSISGNTAGLSGGGIYSRESSPTLVNVVISGNRAGEDGGGIASLTNSSSTLINVTMSGNLAVNEGGAIVNKDGSIVVQNSILWNNEDINGVNTATASIKNSSGTVTIQYSLVQALNPGGANLDGTDPANNPLFITPVSPAGAPTTAGNLRLTTGSPAIDVGNNAYNGASTDLDGNARIVNGTIDLGAYEFPAPTAVTLLNFDVVAINATTVQLEWSTASELGVQGFHLWRSTSGVRSQAVRITQTSIEPQGDLLFGADYLFVDTLLQPGREYTYWLQEVDTNGSITESGPVTVRTPAQPADEQTVKKFYLPLLNR
jgi:predicted outer membrane repeat protein